MTNKRLTNWRLNLAPDGNTVTLVDGNGQLLATLADKDMTPAMMMAAGPAQVAVLQAVLAFLDNGAPANKAADLRALVKMALVLGGAQAAP